MTRHRSQGHQRNLHWWNPLSELSSLEWSLASAAALVLAALAVAEPGVLQAPFENGRTMAFTIGGTALAAAALLVMLSRGVPPVLRVLSLGLPFVAVSWWLISPFFLDDVVDDDFETSIAAAGAEQAADGPTTSAATAAGSGSAPAVTEPAPPAPAAVTPALLGAGRFVGLAGHEGAGDAGFFVLEDGSVVLRLENFDIQNGPDLRLYVVSGADQTSPAPDSLYLGALRGNVGDQTYVLPPEFALTSGSWTVLVWCEAFRVEFVAATVPVDL